MLIPGLRGAFPQHCFLLLVLLLANPLKAAPIVACPGDRDGEGGQQEQYSGPALTVPSAFHVPVTGPKAAAGIHEELPLRRFSAKCEPDWLWLGRVPGEWAPASGGCRLPSSSPADSPLCFGRAPSTHLWIRPGTPGTMGWWSGCSEIPEGWCPHSAATRATYPSQRVWGWKGGGLEPLRKSWWEGA